jgi:tRNA(fMet)-specific endonuclease VapC
MNYTWNSTRYLLDTNAISDIAQEVPRVRSRYQRIRQYQCFVSAITVKEIEYGRRMRRSRTRHFDAELDVILKAALPVPFDEQDALTTGRLHALLAAKGTPIGELDLMIAGTALTRDLVLITDNVREFSRIPNLKIENWREPEGVRENSMADEYYRFREIAPPGGGPCIPCELAARPGPSWGGGAKRGAARRLLTSSVLR